jgi:TolA-binding protein
MRRSKIQNPKFYILNCIFAFCILHFAFVGFAQDVSKEDESLFVAKKAFEDGFYEVSLGLLERFLKNYPDSSKSQEVHLLIGECYYYQNKFLEALAKFEWLLNQPTAQKLQDAILYWIAEVHFKGNDFAKATSYYKKIIDDFPNSSFIPNVYYSMGWCLFQEYAFGEAIEYFKKVEEKFPHEPLAEESAFKIVECLYNAKEYAKLKEKIKSYLKNYPKDNTRVPYLYFYLAEADYYLDNFNEAINEYLKVLNITQDAKIINVSKLGLGWANLKLKRYKEAENIFQEVKEKDLEQSGHEVLLLGKAILLTEEKRFNEAIKIYNDLLNNLTFTTHLVLLQAYLGKADALYNTAEYKEAIDVYKEALTKISEFDPQELVDKLHYGLAWAHLKEGQFKEAIAEFQKIAKQSEDKIVKVSALCQIGDAYQDSGDYKKAIQTYDAILKDYPDNFYSDYVQYQLGICLLKTSNYEGAIMALNSLKNNFPLSKLLDDATYALGLSYFQRENYVAAKDILEKFLEEFKDSNLRPQGMYLLATSLYNLEKFSEAQEVYKNIIRLYDQDTELVQKAEFEIADCYYQMGNEKEALNRFKALRSKYPSSSFTAEIIWWLGEYYFNHNDLDLARRYFYSLIQDFPSSNLIPNAYYALGSIYKEEAKYTEAIENFKKASQLGKTDLAAQASIAVADLYAQDGKIDLALSTYKDVVREFVNLADLIYPKMADIYHKIGNDDEAIDLYRKSLEIVPTREMGDIQFKIAELYETEGKPDEAIEEYLKVTYLYLEDNTLAVKSLLRVAAIYEDKENFKEAINIYKRIIVMNVQEAKYARERIDWIKTHLN